MEIGDKQCVFTSYTWYIDVRCIPLPYQMFVWMLWINELLNCWMVEFLNFWFVEMFDC